MYFGLVLLLAAYYLYGPMLLSPIGLILVIWFLTRFQILPEERILHRKFGEQYARNMRFWFADGCNRLLMIIRLSSIRH